MLGEIDRKELLKKRLKIEKLKGSERLKKKNVREEAKKKPPKK